MGMFDNVRYEEPCWRCGKVLTDWQSKDGPCELLTLEPKDVYSFYTYCECGAWNEFIRDPRPEFAHNIMREGRNT